MSLLDRDAPGLREKLQALSFEARRSVLANACIHAAESLPTSDRRISEFIADLRSRGGLSQQQAHKALSLAQEEDDQYLALKKRGATLSEYSKPFSLARLLTGIGLAFGAPPGEAVADAVYELTKAVDDPAKIVRVIESDIESQSQK